MAGVRAVFAIRFGSALQRQWNIRPGTRILPAHFHPTLHRHRLQPDHHAKPPGSHEPGGRRTRGAPVLPAGEGPVLPRAQVLPLLHVCAGVHRAGAGHPPVSVAV